MLLTRNIIDAKIENILDLPNKTNPNLVEEKFCRD